MADLIESDVTFSEDEIISLSRDLWGRFEGTADSSVSLGLDSGNGIHSIMQLRRQHRFKLPEANPQLPFELGTQPNYQSDLPRQKSEEFTARCLENRFLIEIDSSIGSDVSRKTAAKAEWLLTYGATSMQERSRRDWQKALVQGACDMGFGVIHWRKASDMYPVPPDYEYCDEMPSTPAKASRFQPVEEAVGGDKKKGKFRETPDSLEARMNAAKAVAPFPWNVEIPTPDSVAFQYDTSQRPGPAIFMWVKEVGILDYNKEISGDNARLVTNSSRDGSEVRVTLEQLRPGSGIELETAAPVGNTPSVMGWSAKVGMCSVWTREEYYELVSPRIITGTGVSLGDDWILVKAMKHGYGRVPFAIACASVNENENDPALRYKPALDGIYQLKPIYDFHRSLETSIAIRSAQRRYYISTQPGTAPVIGGDDEGDPIDLQRDSEMAERLAPGERMEAVSEPDLNPAFVRNRELAGEELVAASPSTGKSPIGTDTRPWAIRLGQAQENAYPTMVMTEVDRALQEMFENWVDVMAKPVEEGGLGVGVTVWGEKSENGKATGKPSKSAYVTMEPEEWEGLWVSVNTNPVSSAEQTTKLQMGIELLNNPMKIRTREMFVSEDLGVEDAPGYMQDVYAEEAIIPFLKQIITQRMAKKYGSIVVVGADGTMVGPGGVAIQPGDALKMKGWTQPPAPGGPTAPAPQGSNPLQAAQPPTNMNNMPALNAPGVAPLPGMVG